MRVATAMLVLVAAALLASCSVPVVKPGWQDQNGGELRELRLSGKPASVLSSTVKFTPGDNDNNGLTISAGGDQAAWVSVDPSRLPRVDLGVAYPVTVRVNVPADARTGSYSASVKLLTGKKEAGYLAVKIEVE